MSEETHKTGDWSEADLDLVTGDYFVMLAKQLAGKDVNAASHQRALRFVTGRPGGAIEFRQRNISAALTLVGIPILKDFAPRWKLHDQLIDAVDRQLFSRPSLIAAAMRPPVLFTAREPLHLVEGPPPVFDPDQLQPSPRAEQLIARFDPAGRDHANTLLAEAGRTAVLAFEQRRLRDRGRADLADQVRFAKAAGDLPGHDILSFKPTGEKRLIVVKTTTGGVGTPMALTDDEDALWTTRPDIFRLYRLYDLGGELRFYKLRPPQAVPSDVASSRGAELKTPPPASADEGVQNTPTG